MLRHLANFLTKEQFKRILHSHFFSILHYCSNVWAGCINSPDRRRLNSLTFKMIRLNCRDFSRIHSNIELCKISKLRSFNSASIKNDALMLYSLVTNNTNTVLTLKLIERAISFSRYPNKLAFFDASKKCIGRQSFANRSKLIAELIPFDWAHLNRATFKRRLNIAIPLHIA